MSKGKKYDYQLKQVDDTWLAEITRRVTSSKTVVSKQQDGFESEAVAETWAKQQISEFSDTQAKNNQRQSASRKEGEKTRSERSARRAEKTAKTKQSENQPTTEVLD